ncbi:MAG: ATP-binding protein [Clostridia bacterium]|nr:ATP-binding protein [Clostridia bacterium]
MRLIMLDISIQLQSLYNTMRSALAVCGMLLVLLFIILIPVAGRISAAFVRHSEQQKRFITDAGHELKTPVAIIRANLEVMELTQGKSNWSGNILGQVKRLETLIPQLVMLSRLEEENTARSLQPVALSELAQEEWQSYLPPMDTKAIAHQADIPDGLAVTGDGNSLRQMLRLLMDNAVQYTPDGGSITLTITHEGKHVQLCLVNTVDAFPTQQPQQLTERFARGTTARTQRTGGSGIGLAAVKRIAEINRARLKIEYREPDLFAVVVEMRVGKG